MHLRLVHRRGVRARMWVREATVFAWRWAHPTLYQEFAVSLRSPPKGETPWSDDPGCRGFTESKKFKGFWIPVCALPGVRLPASGLSSPWGIRSLLFSDHVDTMVWEAQPGTPHMRGTRHLDLPLGEQRGPRCSPSLEVPRGGPRSKPLRGTCPVFILSIALGGGPTVEVAWGFWYSRS